MRRTTTLGGVFILGALLVVALADPVLAAETGSDAPPTAFTMERFLGHWWVFPAAIVFSTIALASGVSGALFFSPFFMLGVGLAPAQAIGAGLLTEVFGMGNGLRSYVKQGVVDYRTAKWLLAGAVPAVIVGAFAAHFVDPTILKLLFGAGLIILGTFLVYYDPAEDCEPGESENEYLKERNTQQGTTTIEAADGETYTYDTCWRPPGVGLSTAGGFITGLISAGLPEIVTTQLIVRCRLPPRVAVATSVFTLGIAAAAGALVHALTATPVWYVVAWSIPGVLVGGTIGTRVGKYVPSDLMELGLGIVFALVGALVLSVELLA
jgi:uncharacterized membrane protein YfcA